MASVVTGPPRDRRGTASVAPTTAATDKNIRRSIPFRLLSRRLIFASPLAGAEDAASRLLDLGQEGLPPDRANVFVGDPSCRIDEEALRQPPSPVVDSDLPA